MNETARGRVVRLRLRALESIEPTPAAVYWVAGTWLAADRAVPDLAPFSAPALPACVEPRPPVDWTQRGVERVVYRGPGMVAGAMREVECLRLRQGWEVVISDVCRLGVARNGDEVAVLDLNPAMPLHLLAQAATGPGLILALAVRDVYCLHASAVGTPHGVIAFLGESGSGKSTLARFLADSGLGWTRLGDDILPVEPTPNGLDVLPHFPQLKLPADGQYPSADPERLPLRLACVLASDRSVPPGPVTLERLEPLPASLALLRHTSAARLFDRLLAARHLEVCGRAVTADTLCALHYPLSFEALPEVAQRLAAAAQAPRP